MPTAPASSATAKRVLDRLRDEHGFTGVYTIVKANVREHQRRGREMFVPLHHAPGHAQADFGEALVVIGGVEQTAHFLTLDLPQSDAFQREVQQCWRMRHRSVSKQKTVLPCLISPPMKGIGSPS
jgi:transposase